MSQLEKLLHRIRSLSKDIRFDELRKVLELYGYHMDRPKGGSSHCTFRKQGENAYYHSGTPPNKSCVYKNGTKMCLKRRNSMKDLAYYMNLPYRMEIIPDTEEGGYGVRFRNCPDVSHAGDTLEEAVGNAMDAKKAWLEAAIEDGIAIAEPGDADPSPGSSLSSGCLRACTGILQSIQRQRGVSM